MQIRYEKLNKSNFNAYSLDNFVRRQQVTECWRKVEGAWQLQPNVFVDDWSLEQRREIATDVALHMEDDQTAFGAFDGNNLVGFATLSHVFFGQTATCLELVCFQVSEPYRGKGIGKNLFSQICNRAKDLGAQKLYISGHSAKESQSVYKALGCVHAVEINQQIADGEPFDVQLECDLSDI